MDKSQNHGNTYGLEGDPRVYFAAERTLLAWIRTGLALMGFGFVVARFGLFLRELAVIRGANMPAATHPPHLSLWLGTTMVLLGIVINALAGMHHARFVREFTSGHPPTLGQGRMGIWLAWLLAGLGVAMAGYLIFVAIR